MRLEHHLVGGYVRYISPHIIIIIKDVRFVKIPYTNRRPQNRAAVASYVT